MALLFFSSMPFYLFISHLDLIGFSSSASLSSSDESNIGLLRLASYALLILADDANVQPIFNIFDR